VQVRVDSTTMTAGKMRDRAVTFSRVALTADSASSTSIGRANHRIMHLVIIKCTEARSSILRADEIDIL
jgi:hypothetical protein